jgi:hypothetical protein
MMNIFPGQAKEERKDSQWKSGKFARRRDRFSALSSRSGRSKALIHM